MSTENPNPAPNNDPEPQKPKRTRGVVNKKFLQEVKDSRAVATAALDSAYAPGLAEVELDATIAPGMITLAKSIETSIGNLQGGRAGKGSATDQEAAAREALIAVIAPIQTAAKRVFKGDTEKLRDAYFIGTSLANQSLDFVLLAARAIHERLSPGENNVPPKDTLPGINAAKIQELSGAIGTYDDKNTTQEDQDGNNQMSLEQIETAVATLAGKRHDIQLAADQRWPWRAQGVRTIRKTFLLPEDQPLE